MPTQEYPRILTLRGVEECVILERLNRFTVRVEIGGWERLVFLQNTGRLLEYMVRGRRGFCIPVKRPRKLSRRLFAILEDDLAAIVDTYLQARAFEEAVGQDLIPWLRGCRISRRDIPLAGTRIDYLMSCGLGDMFLELKSAVLRVGHHASYPDCPSSRAVRQVRGMLELIERGGRAIITFIAALPHVRGFKLNHEVDPALCELIARAHEAGLEVKAVQMTYEPAGSSIILLSSDLPIEI
ncbi:MAG: DNA/RNA nuclease SfsA [Thaumarchaeota archaeon]|jgi:sugar fermentation stimulation protein A|nr:DNA/RNA nuclease SfsA [Nitrososphaerota archaeon]MCL7385979.1 DNA/RNA nuclease SfsA [Candidatus Wolframiiraptor allenii]